MYFNWIHVLRIQFYGEPHLGIQGMLFGFQVLEIPLATHTLCVWLQSHTVTTIITPLLWTYKVAVLLQIGVGFTYVILLDSFWQSAGFLYEI